MVLGLILFTAVVFVLIKIGNEVESIVDSIRNERKTKKTSTGNNAHGKGER